MYKLFKRILLAAVVILTAAACQINPALPTETSEPPTPEPIPTPAVITAENAEKLSPAHSSAISTGAVTIVWRTDGAAYWIEDQWTVSLHDGETGEVIASHDFGEYSAVYAVSPDGKTVAYSQDGLEIRLFDILSQTDAVTITPDSHYSSVVFSPDGRQVAASSQMDIKVMFWDTGTGAEMGSVSGFSTAAPVYSAKFGDDGKTLLWFSRGTVQPMDIASQTMGPVLSHEDFVTNKSGSPDGKVIATTAAGMVGGEYQPVLTMWDAKSGEILRQNAIPTYYSSISFSPDSKLIATGTEEGIIIYTVPHGDEIAHLGSNEIITSIAFSPDGKKLAAGGDAGTVTIYAITD